MNDLAQLEESGQLEHVAPDALAVMERASIDSQVSTAKKYPRSLSMVKAKMLSFATLDQETASGCFFTLPARKGGDGKSIQGPSIRMAEIALATYQNLRAGARVIADDGKIITAQGVCHDLENNVCISVEVKRRVTTKEGRRFSDDMVVMTGNAACSIALRNATFRVVPLALVKPVYEQAKKVAIGDAKTLVSRRADAMTHFTKMGVKKEQVFAVLGVNNLEDISLDHLAELIGYATAIKEGDTSIDEVFSKAAATPPPFLAPQPTTVAEAAAQIPKDPVTAITPPLTEAPKNEVMTNLAGYMLKDGVSETELMTHIQGSYADCDSLTSLEEVNDVKPSVINSVLRKWSTVVKAVKQPKAE